MNKTKKDRPKMGDLLKELPAVSTPIQEVRPVVKKTEAEDLVRINGFDAPADIARRLKIHAATADMKQREIIIEALDAYLPK